MDKGPWYHYIQILYQKNKAQFHGLVHERLAVQGNMGILEAEIEHTPFHCISEWVERHNRYTSLAAQELYETHGTLPWKTIRRHLFYKSFKMFWKLFIMKRAYRDGIYGFIFSVLYAFEHFLKWVKYWELVKDKINNEA